MSPELVVGVDFGTGSARAVVVDTRSGSIIGSGEAEYPRWTHGEYCDPNRAQFRQHPQDYLEALELCVRRALEEAGGNASEHVKGIAVDTTGSTPCPVNREGIPLALLDEFRNNPNAMFHLWKDHTAVAEAAEIDHVLSQGSEVDYTKFQGTYSSEWFWAKILRTVRVDSDVEQAAWSWVEHCDWIPALLSGRTDPMDMYRSSCAAGHKALWSTEFGGLPPKELFANLHPYLGQIWSRYTQRPQPADTSLGAIDPAWAQRLSLNPRVVVGGSSLDAHAAGVGAGIRPKTMVKVIGTSSVDLMIVDRAQLPAQSLKTICGLAEDSIIPGFWGLETGQAVFGDLYNWFKELLMWPIETIVRNLSFLSSDDKLRLQAEVSRRLIDELAAAGAQASSEVLALDWFNGRRYPEVNEELKGALFALDLGSDAPAIFRALVLATAFGSRRIFDSLAKSGLEIDHIIAAGGISQRSPFVMQTLADVLNRKITVASTEHASALGAAIYAAVAAGIYETIPHAQDPICGAGSGEYEPNPAQRERYDLLYQKYLAIGNFTEGLLDV